MFLRRKINFFSYLLRLHYGPCAIDHLKSPYPILRKQIWEKLKSQLETLQLLCQQEQMFLVEALERLHVNAQLNSVSLGLLHEVLIKTNRDGHTVHALLLVNNKLLGLYSNEKCPELLVSDILMLIVLIKNRFRYNDKTVPKSIYRTSPILSDGNSLLKEDKILFQSNYTKSEPTQIKPIEESASLLSSNASQQEFHSAISSTSLTNDEGFYTPQVQNRLYGLETDEAVHTPQISHLATEHESDVLQEQEVVCFKYFLVANQMSSPIGNN